MDDLTLVVGQRELIGWTSIRVTRGIERLPSDFEILMTDLFPEEVDAFVVAPGAPCVVKLGEDVVLTGYVDRFSPMIDKGQHSIRVSGRGKCCDLVDCSAEWPGGQMSGLTALEIARQLVKPYGIFSDDTPDNPIFVTSDTADVGPIIPQQNLIIGETPYTIIERICRFATLLAYEDADGDLFLTRAGTAEAASGVEQGKNVQRASLDFALDGCYSQVYGFIQSFDSFMDLGDRGNLQAIAEDPNVKRHRRMTIIAEAGDSQGFDVLKSRAVWEVARRNGRAQALHVTVDSWRDSAGTLWTPNTLAPISLPALKLAPKKWLISQVTYSRNGESGTTAELVMMPREAFLPQPVILMPGLGGVDQQAQQ
jgi:prophage tail gpP-like protein